MPPVGRRASGASSSRSAFVLARAMRAPARRGRRGRSRSGRRPPPRPSAGSGARRASSSTGRSSSAGTWPKSARSDDLVRDLRPGRRHEVVEEPRGDVLLLGGELGHRALEMLLDDVLRAPEALERLEPKDVGAGRALLLPQPLHDELEVRRLDPRAVVAALDRPERRRAPARSARRRPRRGRARRAPARPRPRRPSARRSARPGARSPPGRPGGRAGRAAACSRRAPGSGR